MYDQVNPKLGQNPVGNRPRGIYFFIPVIVINSRIHKPGKGQTSQAVLTGIYYINIPPQ